MSQSLRRYLLIATVGLCVLVLGYRDGSYGELQRAEAAAVACLAAIAFIAGGARLARPGPFAFVGGLLAGLIVWTTLSLLWAPSADDVVPQIILLGIYLGVFVFVGFAARPKSLSAWCDGIAIGVGVIGWAALLSRFFPDLIEAARPNVALLSGSASRLAFPVGYWNGLGILMACVIPLALRSAISGSAMVARQIVSIGFLPTAATVIYLASSRGAALTAAVAVIAYVLCSGSRWVHALAAALLGLAGSAVAVAVVTRSRDLVDHPLSAAAADAGPWVCIALVLVCLLTGVAFVVVHRRLLAGLEPSARATWAVAGVVGVAGLVFLVVADVPARFNAFKSSPFDADTSTIRAHFLSSGSTGRWQLWSSSVDEFRTAPVHGRGAGSFEAWWAEHGSLPVFVRNAHSLYLETLGELGIVGFLLLIAFVLGSVGLGISIVRRTAPRFRYQPAAPLAVFVAFVFAATLDWVWQLPVIGVLAVGCVALLAGAASGEPDPAVRAGYRTPAGLVAICCVALLIPLFALATIDATAQVRLGASEHAAGRGDSAAALRDAQAARALEPWSAVPLLRLALIEEQLGSLPVARGAIEESVKNDPTDWRLWLIAARLQAKAGDIKTASRSLAEARRLNPRSPLFAASG